MGLLREGNEKGIQDGFPQKEGEDAGGQAGIRTRDKEIDGENGYGGWRKEIIEILKTLSKLYLGGVFNLAKRLN